MDYLLYIAIPEGRSTYVLRKDLINDLIEIWNPTTGEAFAYENEKFTTSCFCF